MALELFRCFPTVLKNKIYTQLHWKNLPVLFAVKEVHVHTSVLEINNVLSLVISILDRHMTCSERSNYFQFQPFIGT